MIVRCGACRTQFDVAGPGRFTCPACGSVNMVREAAPEPAGQGPAGAQPGFPGPGAAPPPPPPPPPAPSPRIVCPECDFSFIVGKIEKASCPNCGSDVETGWSEPAGGN